MNIGILQSSHASGPIRVEPGDYDVMYGPDLETFRVVDSEFPDGPMSATLAFGDRICTVRTHSKLTSATIAELPATQADAVVEDQKERVRRMLNILPPQPTRPIVLKLCSRAPSPKGNRHDGMD